MSATSARSMGSWDEALAELVAEGAISAEVAGRVAARHGQLVVRHQQHARRHRVIELSGYAGAALFIGGVAAAGSQLWEDVGAALQILLSAGAALVLAVAAVVIAMRAPGGLLAAEQGARRRLVGVLGVAAAGLMATTVELAIHQAGASYRDWLPLVFATGLLGSAVTAWRAPGAVATLAVLGFTLATVTSTIDAAGAIETEWIFGGLLTGLGVFGALVLVRVLPPAVLSEGLSLALWVGAAGALANGNDDSVAKVLGLIALAGLTVLGSWRFIRGARWPWAVAAAIALALATQAVFTETLGAAVAMILAGASLIAVSAALAWTRREPRRPGASEAGEEPGVSAESAVSTAARTSEATSRSGHG